jgi:hypothetical protein
MLKAPDSQPEKQKIRLSFHHQTVVIKKGGHAGNHQAIV